MNVLSISYGYHDASVAIAKDGKLLSAIAEERLSRSKHDPNFPKFAIEECLSQSQLEISDVDRIIFHEDPFSKFSRVLASSFYNFPFSYREFTNAMKSWIGGKLWAFDQISSQLGVDSNKISYLSHHFSHSSQAFMGSGFSDAAILIVDAVGDWASTALYSGKWENGKPKIDRIYEVAFPHSLGLVYSAVTAYLGFSPNDSECSTMALAAFGKPKYVEEVRKIVHAADRGSYLVDQSFFNFTAFYRGPVTRKFYKLFGEGRPANQGLNFSSFAKTDVSADEQRWADIACSFQQVLEERILDLAKHLKEVTGSSNLCLAGGVALNCVANYKLLKSEYFDKIFIPPDPGDGGTSIGSALFGSLSSMPEETESKNRVEACTYQPYTGFEMSEDQMMEYVDFLEPKQYMNYIVPGVSKNPDTKYKKQHFENFDVLLQKVSQLLTEKKVVGWVQGRAEVGPRALGHRSILFCAGDLDLARRVSQKVKLRAMYRPYALSMTSQSAIKILDVPQDRHSMLRWMQYAVPVKEEYWEELCGGLHIDKTTRPQICFEDDSPRFHRLLTEFEKQSGKSAIVNTSFNHSGYPLVNNPDEALAMFIRTDMDALVINNSLIVKET